MRPANNRKSSSTDSDLYDESEHHILPSNPTAEVVRDSNRNLYETAPSTTLQDDNAGSTQARIKNELDGPHCQSLQYITQQVDPVVRRASMLANSIKT